MMNHTHTHSHTPPRGPARAGSSVGQVISKNGTQIIGVYACTQVVPCRDQADSIQVRPPASESAESKIVAGGKEATNA